MRCIETYLIKGINWNSNTFNLYMRCIETTLLRRDVHLNVFNLYMRCIETPKLKMAYI